MTSPVYLPALLNVHRNTRKAANEYVRVRVAMYKYTALVGLTGGAVTGSALQPTMRKALDNRAPTRRSVLEQSLRYRVLETGRTGCWVRLLRIQHVLASFREDVGAESAAVVRQEFGRRWSRSSPGIRIE